MVASARALYERAERLGMDGDAERAFEASLDAYQQAKRAKDPDVAPMVLEQVIRHAWAAGRYPDAISITKSYVRKTGRRVGPYDLSVHLLYAHMLSTLGHMNEAINVLDRAESLDFVASIDDFVRLLHERAFAMMQLGLEEPATVLFRQSVELARRRANPHLTAQTLGNYAVHDRYCGRMDEALELHAEVTAFARRMHINWRAQYYIVNHGLTEFYAGHLDRAHDLLLEAARGEALSQQVEMTQTALGLFLGVMMGKHDLIRRYSDESTLDVAFASCEPVRIANVIAAMHLYYVSTNRFSDARRLLKMADDVIGYPYCCPLLYRQIAAHGDVAMLNRAIECNATMSPESHRRDAFDKLLRAGLERITQEKNGARQADLAALAFDKLKWPLHHATALELAGRYREAANVYAVAQANAEARRLRAIRLSAGRPRRVGGQLTTREWEIAKLCVNGLRNQEIAKRLGVTVGTVKFHIRNILHELNLTSRYELRDALLEFQ